MGRWLALALLLALSIAARAQPIHPFPDDLPDFYYFGGASAPRPVSQGNGKTLVAGFWPRGFAIVRVNEDGSVDRAFGKGGVAELVLWGAGEYAPGPYILPMPDGRILVAGNVKDGQHVPGCNYAYTECNIHIALFRLERDGRRDASFNGYGRLVLRVGPLTAAGTEDQAPQYVGSLKPLADGAVLIRNGELPIGRLSGAGKLDVTAPYPAYEHDFIAAVPFSNLALGQYFETADPNEISALERVRGLAGWTSDIDGWFHVYPAGWTSTPTVPVCRFYGLPQAGLDSHLLSASAEECAALEAAAERGWILESREVFRVELPDPVTGACPVGRSPVYRLWNGRPDGGHHLTTARYTRDNLVAEGYVSEGWGPLGVAMCSAP